MALADRLAAIREPKDRAEAYHLLQTCKKRKKGHDDKEYADQVRRVVTEWYANKVSGAHAPTFDETSGEYKRRRMRALAEEWPEGKQCYFGVCHIEFDRVNSLKVLRLHKWHQWTKLIVNEPTRFGFHHMCGHMYCKSIYCYPLVATEAGVFLKVRDKLHLGDIRLLLSPGGPHRIWAFTANGLGSEEVSPSKHEDPLAEAERFIRCTHALHCDYNPRLDSVPTLTSSPEWE